VKPVLKAKASPTLQTTSNHGRFQPHLDFYWPSLSELNDELYQGEWTAEELDPCIW
jgi:hypothetical protein